MLIKTFYQFVYSVESWMINLFIVMYLVSQNIITELNCRKLIIMATQAELYLVIGITNIFTIMVLITKSLILPQKKVT